MAETFGDIDPQATRVINWFCRVTDRVGWTPHARDEMANDDFDDMDVLTCLRRGKAYGPEIVKGQTRYNVLHKGLHIRVVVGLPMGAGLQMLERLTVVTVMRIKI